ncbi:MAG: hypothetical protein ACI9DC_001296 [Gammaproteobacteria bacterium]|jgi:hypothetical protein
MLFHSNLENCGLGTPHCLAFTINLTGLLGTGFGQFKMLGKAASFKRSRLTQVQA